MLGSRGCACLESPAIFKTASDPIAGVDAAQVAGALGGRTRLGEGIVDRRIVCSNEAASWLVTL